MSGPICDKCGKVHLTRHGTPACTAHITQDRDDNGKVAGDPCTQAPRKGGYVCRFHGGSTRHIAKAAQLRLVLGEAEGEIADLMRACDIPEQDPVSGLLEVVRVSGAMMRLLHLKVGELAEDPELHDVLVEGRNGELSVKTVSGRQGFWGLSKDGEMVPHPYVQLLRLWSERYEKACKTALDAGVAERQVRVEEQKGELFAVAVRAILDGLNLTPEQWELAPTVVATQLRALA